MSFWGRVSWCGVRGGRDFSRRTRLGAGNRSRPRRIPRSGRLHVRGVRCDARKRGVRREAIRARNCLPAWSYCLLIRGHFACCILVILPVGLVFRDSVDQGLCSSRSSSGNCAGDALWIIDCQSWYTREVLALGMSPFKILFGRIRIVACHDIEAVISIILCIPI